MDERSAENSLIDNSGTAYYNPDRPWPWVSYDDPAWPLDPWIVSNHEDLADAAVRLAVWYLHVHVEGVSMLRAAALCEDAMGRVVADVVAEARTRRFSWGRIAEHFGVGRTAAQKRFGKHPRADRAQELEQQYRMLSEYLYAAERDSPAAYPDQEEARITRARCIRRRRGRYQDPLDQVPKVVVRRRRGIRREE
ncbi:hypothetical protein [Streptomyces asoensis]|uniref:hypothetical protein n=1 Tax=Streptomyces asoensis TaxID=249586 RepID=UPI0033D42F18